MNVPEVISLRKLSVRLGGRAILRDLDATLHGQCIGLLGPNGSGKTTLINALLGFCRTSGGTADIFGTRVGSTSAAVQHLVGYMPENDAFVANMTGVSFVRTMAELSGLPPDVALERAHEVLFYVGLGEARYRELGTYSLGMKQMVKLAQALAHGPRLLFLDEPTNGLDPPARRRMLRLIREIRDSGDTHIVISSHLLPDIESCCDEVLILKQGRVAGQIDLAAERADNRQFVTLQILGSEAAFVAAVRALGCEAAQQGRSYVRVVLAADVTLDHLYGLAHEHQVQLRRVRFQRDSLEDMFLQAMEQPSPEPAAQLTEAAAIAVQGGR